MRQTNQHITLTNNPPVYKPLPYTRHLTFIKRKATQTSHFTKYNTKQVTQNYKSNLIVKCGQNVNHQNYYNPKQRYKHNTNQTQQTQAKSRTTHNLKTKSTIIHYRKSKTKHQS